MNNTEEIISKVLAEIGQDITRNKFLSGLIENKKKFEGWVQIELASRIYGFNKFKDVIVEKEINNNGKIKYADIVFTAPNNEKICIEVKFIVSGKATTNSRDSFCEQLQHNKFIGKSFGGAILIRNINTNWFKKEIDRIINTKVKGICCNIREIPGAAYLAHDKKFEIRLFECV